MTPTRQRKPKLPALQREALEFLRDFRERMRRKAGSPEREPEYMEVYWFTLDPSYTWRSKLGVSFNPATLRALRDKGLIDMRRGHNYHCRINYEGVAVLRDLEASGITSEPAPSGTAARP